MYDNKIMFVSKDLDKNDKIINDCKKLIQEHNKLGFESYEFDDNLITFDHIKPKQFKYKDSISTTIITFFEQYVSQMSSTMRINHIIESTEYTNEDLSIHIDRSTDSILQIFSALSEKRLKLMNHYDDIIRNVQTASELFVQYVSSNMSEKTNLEEVITVIFICMSQSVSIDKATDSSDERPFIPIGIQLIRIIRASKFLTPYHIEHIRNLNEGLKKDVLSSSQRMQTSSRMNKLQRFNITPDEGPNQELSFVVEKLFGMKIKSMSSIKESIEPLKKILKVVSSSTGKQTGLIVIISSNDDTFFDMTSLNTETSINDSRGVDDSMVRTFDLLKVNTNKKADTSELITIGIDTEITETAYVIWTNDLKTFKVRTKPIHGRVIKNICRNAPSEIVGSFNEMLATSIITERSEDVLSFKRVKYMAFDDTVSEETFLKKFQDKLVSIIMKTIGALEGVKLRTSVTEDSFTKHMLDSMELSKLDIGIHPKILPAHCHIIYASMANKILFKIKKELIIQNKLNKTLTSEIVRAAVESNDNIYGRVIASYYLHIA